MKPILCVDFDGVIHSYTSGWKGARVIPDPPVYGAMDFLNEATRSFKVCIYSSRSRYFGGRKAMIKWFRKYLNHEIIDELSFPLMKPAAFLQIDDRAICFNGVFPSIEEMRSFKPWYKK